MYEQLVINIIREVFVSPDMQEYLCSNTGLLDDHDIVNIVRKAFIPLERKLELFKALSVYEDRNVLEAELAKARAGEHVFGEDWIKQHSYYYQVQALTEAINNLKIQGKEDGVLLLIEHERRGDKEQIVGDLPFFSYEKLQNFIKDYIEEETVEELRERHFWYSIEKYVEAEESELNQAYTYYVFDGEIIYYEAENSSMGSGVAYGGDLNVPVPFQPGDLVVCDGGPTCDETRAVILRTGDNFDCCSLVSLCRRANQILEYEPVKHSNMFLDTDTKVIVPPLYTLRRMSSKMKNEEAALSKIGTFIKGDEDRGYIVERGVCTLHEDEVTDEYISSLENDYQEWYKLHRQ